ERDGWLPAADLVIAPPPREYGEGLRPADDALPVETGHLSQNVDPASSERPILRRGADIRDRVEQEGRAVEGGVADDALGVDRQPAALVAVEHVHVMVVAMDQHRRRRGVQ